MASKINYVLPQEFSTWKDYCNNLLDNLPMEFATIYKALFEKSDKFWHNVGGGFTEEELSMLKEEGYEIKENGLSPYSRKVPLTRVIFLKDIPDTTENLKIRLPKIPSYRRNCIAILKNDFAGKTLGF